ncbi:MAG: alpha/beta hydrolase family protein [Bacteroidales bacterium]
MKNFVWIFFLISVSALAQQKKEVIKFEDLGQGPVISSYSLTAGGNYALISEKKGKDEISYLKNLTTMHCDTLGDIGKWSMPSSDVILFTGSGKAKPLVRFNVKSKSYDTLQPQTNGFVAIGSFGCIVTNPKKAKGDKESTYRLIPFKSPKWSFDDTISVYAISGDEKLLFVASQLDGKTKLSRINVANNQIKEITYDFVPKQIFVNGNGLWVAMLNDDKIELIDANMQKVSSKEVPSGWSVATTPKPFFSGSDGNLCAYLEPKTDKKEDGKAEGIDIWDWRDVSLVSAETRRTEHNLSRKYLWIFPKAGNPLQVENDTLLKARPLGDDSRYLVAIVEYAYQMQRSWESGKVADYYLVDLKENKTSLFRKASNFYVNSSPKGKYLYWFDIDSSWNFLNLSTQKTFKLQPNSNDQYFNIQFDEPSTPGPYAAEGWTENDEWIILKAFHDLYMCDPSGVKPTICITNGYGVKNNMQFRVTESEKKRGMKTGAKIVLEGFSLNTMQSGLFNATLGKALNPKQLVWGDFRIDGVKMLDDGKDIFYTQESYSSYPDIFMLRGGKGKPERITSIGDYYSRFAYGSVKLLEWKNPEGGMLRGMLYLPDSTIWKKPYPVVLNIYERKSENLNLFLSPELAEAEINIPYFVSNGYAVFIPDVVFRVGNPGESSYQCVSSGLAYVLNNYSILDSSKVGIQGHSWGAYQSAYLATRMHDFKAIVSMAPVSDMVSAYGGLRRGVGNSRMFQYESGQSRIGKTLWQAPEAYIKHSTVLYADKITTPLLLISNDGDGAVPWEQGMELFLAMRRLGKPCWMINYKGDAHVLIKKANKEDFTRRMMEMFDYYLKGKPAPDWIERNVNLDI